MVSQEKDHFLAFCIVFNQIIQEIKQSPVTVIQETELKSMRSFAVIFLRRDLFFPLNSIRNLMTNTIDLSKSIPSEQWGEFFDQVSGNHLGRHISIEIIDAELGDEELIKNAPLMAMIYDRPGKGNNLAIEVGKEEVTYAHTIDEPTEVLTGQNLKGEIVAIWIAEADGRKTLVKLQAS